MAVGVLLEFSELTQDQYDAIVAEMNLGGRPPQNATFHVAGPTSDGRWRVVDVWESAEAFQAFAAEKIMPLSQKHGMTAQPTVDIWEVHNILM